jgi:transcriptional regulator with XRE-family HTH domain
MTNLEQLMGQQLLLLRERAGLTIPQLAMQTDISVYALTLYECGKRHIDAEHLFALCDFFGLTIEGFMKSLEP